MKPGNVSGYCVAIKTTFLLKAKYLSTYRPKSPAHLINQFLIFAVHDHI